MHIVIVFIWPLSELIYAKSLCRLLREVLQIDPHIILLLQVFDSDLICNLLSKLCIYWYVCQHRLFDDAAIVVSFRIKSDLVCEHDDEFPPEPAFYLRICPATTRVIVTLHELDLKTLSDVRVIVALDLKVLIYTFELRFEVFYISP